MVVFWKELEVEEKETGETKRPPVIRYYRVFNADQCEGVAPPETPDSAAVPPLEFEPIAEAERIVAGYGGPAIRHGGNVASYRPIVDVVDMPEAERFVSAEAYYATLFHEFGHSTGHSSRLDRGLDTAIAPFGSADYSREELVAEMASAFLCGHAGIAPATLENAAAYIDGWLNALRGDQKLVVQTAGKAQRAADLILGVTFNANGSEHPNG